MSIIPGEGVTIANGNRFELRGRTYPALSSSAKLKLYYCRNGAWHWLYVPADNIERHTRKVTAGGKTYTLTYSTYSYRIRPPKTTTYRFVTGSSRSPKAKVTVKGTAPAPTPAPSPSPTPTPTPTPSPSPSPSELTVEPGDFFTIATRDFRINRGWVAKYRYEVLFGPQAGETDEGVTADVTLKVRDSGGKSRMTKEFSAVPVNTSQTYEARCWLAPGYYDYYIYATLPDGTTQQSVGKGHFVVRYEDGTMPPAAATTPSPTPSASPTATPSPSPSASPSPSPSPSDTTSPSPSPSTSPSASPSPSPSPTPEPSPSPTATEEPAAAEPRAAALATQVVYRGDTAALPVKVVRSEDGVADIVVRIRKEGSAKTVKTLVLDDCALDRTYKARFRCWLAKGRYRYYVWAVSPDGVWQTGPSSKPLVVR